MDNNTFIRTVAELVFWEKSLQKWAKACNELPKGSREKLEAISMHAVAERQVNERVDALFKELPPELFENIK